ncbi:MAG: RnfABCDGE type electron transport complex subunit B, partial [Chromatiales bacterium]|nr:RnfABCDGE type electron transport complex subunit B [Chromatiales bacterium]
MTAVLVIAALGAGFGLLLGFIHWRFPPDVESLAARVDQLLPQTQCAQCGYPGCRPYADAIADGSAGINQCPPGGEETVAALAALLDIAVQKIDPSFGETKPPQVAFVVEEQCIGCALCLPACPV